MKIMHIITTLSSGGAERMLSKLVKKDNLNTHIVVTLLEGNIHYTLKGIKIINLNKKNNIINKITLLNDLVKVIKDEDVDIIQTWLKCNYYGPLIKYRFPDIKLVSNFRNGYNRKESFLKTISLNYFLQKFDGHIFVSKSALDERTKANLKFNNYVIINNGFEVPKTTKLNRKSDTLVIGHIGRYHPVKNQKNIVKAFNSFSKGKNVNLLLAGRDLNLKKLKLLDIVNPKIICLGEILSVHEFYQKIDVLVMASKSEGFPNVIGEAMSYGKYIISTNAGESFEILGRNGFKLPDGEVSSICRAFEYIYSKKTMLEEEGTENRMRISNVYNLDLIIKQYQQYYNKLGV